MLTGHPNAGEPALTEEMPTFWKWPIQPSVGR